MKKIEVKSEVSVETNKAKKSSVKESKKPSDTATAPEVSQTKAALSGDSKAATAKKATKIAEQIAVETTPIAAKEPSKKKPSNPKAPKKAAVTSEDDSVSSSVISVRDRVGLTAGTVWHYLADNGPGSVDKLIKALPEDSTIVQRSIGWLAQENKIVLTVVDGVEMIALTA